MVIGCGGSSPEASSGVLPEASDEHGSETSSWAAHGAENSSRSSAHGYETSQNVDSSEGENPILLQAPTNVEIEDMALRTALWSALNKPPGTEFTNHELLDITQLEFGPDDTGGVELKSLKGIGALENLVELKLKDSQFTDISSLTGLKKLSKIELHLTGVSDISVVAGLASLIFVSLNADHVYDFAPLLESGLSPGNWVKVVGKWQEGSNGPDVITTLKKRAVHCYCP